MRTVSVVLSALILGIVLVLPVNRIPDIYTCEHGTFDCFGKKNPGNLVIELYMIIIMSMPNGKGKQSGFK